jgi:hypothetical protein
MLRVGAIEPGDCAVNLPPKCVNFGDVICTILGMQADEILQCSIRIVPSTEGIEGQRGNKLCGPGSREIRATVRLVRGFRCFLDQGCDFLWMRQKDGVVSG